jgi:hypothetical protein
MAAYMSPKDRQRYEPATTIPRNITRIKTELKGPKPKGVKLAVKGLYNSIPPRVLSTVCLIYMVFLLYTCYLVGLKAAAKPPATCALPDNFDSRVQSAIGEALNRQYWTDPHGPRDNFHAETTTPCALPNDFGYRVESAVRDALRQ